MNNLCGVHEFMVKDEPFVCRKCGLRMATKKSPDRDPEKPLKGQKQLSFFEPSPKGKS